MTKKTEYQTIWLSDIHLGNRDCHSEYLLNFLDNIECKALYLVGDIVDVLAMKQRLYWPASHFEVVRSIQEKANNGTRVIYIPGNHDAVMREFSGEQAFNIEIHRQFTHTTIDGRCLLVIHGDELDHQVIYRALYSLIGDFAYDLMVFFNRNLEALQRLFGLPYWSLATYIKTHVREAREIIEKYERAAVKLASERGFDGIVCGHIHKAEMREIDGILYCNDGDWTESCTAMVETLEGNLEILHWSDRSNTIKQHDLQPLVKAA